MTRNLGVLAAIVIYGVLFARGDVVISEFMASNSKTLTDDFGNFEDWIELRNTGTTNVNVLNWSLTDSKSSPTKWLLPATNLPAGSHMVVFASNRNRKTVGQALHTNFKISAGGGYLALRRPDGSVATAFDPYPPQITDIAYGYSTSNNVVKLVTTNATGRFLVPANGAMGVSWISNGFNDVSWLLATNGIGFETGTSEFGLDYRGHVLASTPAGYWRLNETPGGGSVEATNIGSLGLSYNGTPAGGVTFGQVGAIANGGNTSASLDDTGEISVPADFNTQVSSSFSVEFWVRQDSSTAAFSYRSPVFARGPDVHGYNFYISGDESMNIEFWTGSGSGWNRAVSPANAIPVGQWVHVVGVYNDLAATMKLYVNGQTVGSGSAPIYAAAFDGTPIKFGPNQRPLIGGLDEVALYDVALTDANVLAHYQAGTNAAGNYVIAVQAHSPIGWWRLGEPNVSSFAANAGSLGVAANGSYLTPLSAGLTSLRPPTYSGLEPANTSINFNGTGRVSVPFNVGLNTASFTLDFWSRPTGMPGEFRGVLSSYDAAADQGFAVLADSGNSYSFYLGTGGSWKVLGGPRAQIDVWSHLTVTCDGSTAIIYENGVAYLTNSVAYQPNTAANFLIGQSTSPEGFNFNFPGELDEVVYHSTVLTPAQIATRHEIALAGSAGTNRNYSGLIKRAIQAQMLNANASVYYRLPFTVTNVADMSALKVRFKADDGYVAWLNGRLVASANAPGGLTWNSAATDRVNTSEAVVFDETDISDFRSSLVVGTNVLAIQGLNLSNTNADFVNLAEIEATYAGAIGTNAVYLLPSTPGTLNGAGTAAPGPAIASVGLFPPLPTDADSITVTCRVAQILSPIGSVTLNWRVMYGPLTQTSMFDDGLHGDGAAGDGVYGAVIPAANHSAGEMVRWYVTAVDTGTRRSRWPLFLDPLASSEFQGTMISDPSVSSAIPVWYWFTENDAAANDRAGTRCSVYFNGEFFDNVFVRERGQSSAVSGQPSQKFDFNPGDHPKINDKIGRVAEANLNINAVDSSYMRIPVAFDLYRSAGQPAPESFPMLMRANGGADRVAIYIEQPGEDMLERNGLPPTGALYKMINRITLTPMFTDPVDGVEKKTRKDEGRADLQAMCDALQLTGDAEARAAWMFDNMDLANFVNMMACRTLTGDTDDQRKNMYFYHDTLGKKEWSTLPWDKDWTFASVGGHPHPFRGDFAHEGGGANGEQWSYHYEALFNDPRTKEMVLRRMRSVTDLLPPEVLSAKTDFYYTNARSAVTTGGLNTDAQVASLKNIFITRRSQLTNLYSFGEPFIPVTQPTNANINFGAIEFNPASGNQDQEYIELVNTNSIAVDVSGWEVGGAVSMKLDPGTVVVANSSMYVSPNVVVFRARSVSPKGGEKRFVQGNYNGRLNAWGESVTLTDNLGRLVSSNAFVGAPSDVQRYLRVTEIMYNPSPAPAINADAQQFEYIELRNISGSVTLNLNNVRFTDGVAFNFSGSAITSLLPGTRALIVRNQAAFTARYGGGLPIAGQFVGALDSGGETLRLDDAVGEKVLEFAYNNSWYPITDGLGFSLVIVNDNAHWSTWDKHSSWRSSGTLNGQPGMGDPASSIGAVLVNEVLAHTDLPNHDSIELYNPTENPVAIGGWFLTDDFFTPKKYRIASGTVLNAGAYLVFNDTQFNTGANPFLFSEYGEQAYLLSGDANTNLTGYVHGFEFAESPNGVSFGRHVNSRTNTMFVLQVSNTLGSVNAGPRVGPVVISEIMYHPPDVLGVDNDLDEFIELQNISGTNVALFCMFTNEAGYGLAALTNTWRLRDAVDYDFPTNVSLAGNSRLLVVGFNPTNTAVSNAFVAKYSVPASVKIFGPWNGKLDNSGENIELKYPDRPDVTASNVIVPYVMVEKVSYKDDSAWPTNADGLGQSLQRLNNSTFGNDVTNWTANDPTTQTIPVIVAQPLTQLVPAGSNATFSTVATGSLVMNYQWRKNGTVLPGATAGSLLLINVQPPQAGEYTVVISNALGTVTSTPAMLVVQTPLNLVLIQTNSAWRYLDTGVDQGLAWIASGFNDGGWSVGLSKFGYGSGITTVLNYGGNPASKFPTYYFRRQFVVNSLADMNEVYLEVQRDDGIAVYLNGVERYRDNLIAGAIYGDFATNAVDQGQVFQAAYLGTNGLVLGTNFIAAEIHQSSAGSSDLAFDLRLSLIGAGTPPYILAQPQSQSVNLGSDIALSVSASGSPALAYQWQLNGANLPGAVLPTLNRSNVQLANSGNYTVVITNAYGSVTSSVATLVVATAQPPVISHARLVTGPAIEITGIGAPGQNYVLVVATNLAAPVWIPVSTNTASGSGAVVFIREIAANPAAEYFRLRN